MDLSPAMERMWIDEVLHLHSLWRIGPPRHNSTAIDHRLSVANTTSFKRKERRRRKALKKQQQPPPPPLLLQQRERQQQEQGNAIPWPFCQPSSIDEVRRWDEVSSNEGGHPAAIPKPLSDEERVEVAALQAQKDCLKLCIDFFSKQCSSDDDEGIMEEGREEEDELVDSGEEIHFKFFLGIFQKDRDLRAYYEQNSEKGKFFCLVCEGIREKVGRKFKDCVSLVQHSISIIKTKRKEAHRSFSRVVCHILGWNSERLPSVVLDVGDPDGQSLVNASDSSQQIPECVQGDVFRDLNKEHETDIVVDRREVLLEVS